MFVEVCAGKAAPLSRALAAQGWTVISIDTQLHGRSDDLLCKEGWERVRDVLNLRRDGHTDWTWEHPRCSLLWKTHMWQRAFRGVNLGPQRAARRPVYTLVHFAPPCGSFSIIHNLSAASTRSARHPMGIKEGRPLNPSEKLGNALARRCLKLIAYIEQGTRGILPQYHAIVDWCQYGRPYRQSTSLRGRVPWLEIIGRKCCGGHSHTELRGRDLSQAAQYS